MGSGKDLHSAGDQRSSDEPLDIYVGDPAIELDEREAEIVSAPLNRAVLGLIEREGGIEALAVTCRSSRSSSRRLQLVAGPRWIASWRGMSWHDHPW